MSPGRRERVKKKEDAERTWSTDGGAGGRVMTRLEHACKLVSSAARKFLKSGKYSALHPRQLDPQVHRKRLTKARNDSPPRRTSRA